MQRNSRLLGHVCRFHDEEGSYLSGEPRVEFLNLQVGKGTPTADALRP
jgi:hypothetical protein